MEKKTALYETHVRAGARMVPFAGFSMPIQYSGIIDEHRAVRESMGIFDLSHMGELRVSGRDAVAAVDRLLTNDIAGLEDQQIRYSPMCYPDGGIVDDLLVYRLRDELLLVVNASNIEKDLTWIGEHLRGVAAVRDVSDSFTLIAVQGPNAERLVQHFADVDLTEIRYYHFHTGSLAGAHAIVSRTGYTGEDGFELYVSPEDAPAVWNALLDRGSGDGLQPVGLGARDTLRLEAGYMLYGNDIDETTSPLEAGLGWTVKFAESDFIGRDALENQKRDGPRRRMVVLGMKDRGIARPHFEICQHGERVGTVTSGTFSPTFGRGIALGYVQSQVAGPGTEVDITIRGQPHPARVVRKPMYRREG